MYTYPIASGFIAGESIVLALIAVLATVIQLAGGVSSIQAPS